ncbi:MAG: hypothetical protein WD003_00920 [Candidatus Paceibacterota bacterium]
MRLIANAILFVSLLYLPWWLFLVLGIIFLFIFRSFYELVGWSLVVDLLYGTDTSLFFNTHFLMTQGALVLLVVSSIVKKYIRFYEH